VSATRLVRTWGTYGILALLYLYFAFTTPGFGTIGNLRNILVQLVPVVIAGAAVTLVMVGGSLDLSVSGSLALSGVMAAWLSAHGQPLPVALILGMVTGAFIGLVNGGLVVGLGINAVIATLGTAYVATGIANLMSNGSSVIVDDPNFSTLGTGSMGGIQYSVMMMIAVVVVFLFLERFTLLGKYTVALGSNFEGARLAGISVGRLRVLLFVLAGSATGLAGILSASKLNSGQPTIGQGFEFQVIVAAVLGGVSLAGGRGTVLGTTAGAAIVVVIGVALNINNINTFWQQIILGFLLVTVVALDVIFKKDRRLPAWVRVRREDTRADKAKSRAAPPDGG
jgi:ribose/xylose/arabinose/galactoside ABC-type transport system permease subunit